ncbi:hypothetical protein V6C03_00465 [Methyloligella sp. 2.7D]|uniref:hypothetical protein n=1 Tax=unclassified Methyloligella TaxID=2625955 RepID=UPI00157DF85B|nr:hypothetical protein [Methyloligella sp. GL2]QKP76855.1 hypothetical protein HT051_04950 [Methyloligella sp. GL2]
MTKTMVAFVSILLLSGSAIAAESWSDSFTTIDADGNGSISRVEWDQGSQKLDDPTFAPTFKAMDENNSNSVSKAEWAAAQKLTADYSERCRESNESWCN